MREKDAVATWISSSHMRSSKKYPVTCIEYSATVATAPTLTEPCETRKPPHTRTAAVGTTTPRLTIPKSTARRKSVRSSQRHASRIASHMRPRRRSPRPSASIVAECSTVSVISPFMAAHAAELSR